MLFRLQATLALVATASAERTGVATAVKHVQRDSTPVRIARAAKRLNFNTLTLAVTGFAPTPPARTNAHGTNPTGGTGRAGEEAADVTVKTRIRNVLVAILRSVCLDGQAGITAPFLTISVTLRLTVPVPITR